MKINQEMKRKAVQIAAFGFSNTYAGNLSGGKLYKGAWKQFCNPGMNCYSCPAARLACPIGAMQAVSGSAHFNISFYAVGFILALGVLFGRAVCGFLCPFGLIQEFLYRIPFPKRKLHKGFTYVKYLILLVFVLILPVAYTNAVGLGAPAFCQYLCPVGTLEGGIPLLMTHPELRNAAGTLFSVKTGILLLTLIGCLTVSRFFCKVMCPLGAIYGILNKISLYHMEFYGERCISCGKCANVCPMDVNPVENPDSAECIRCGKCASHCPGQALALRFGKSRSRSLIGVSQTINRRIMQMEYKFWGWENADTPSITDEYKGIQTPVDLYNALSDIWCADTCAPRMRAGWTKENRTLGQCSITAFLAQDIFGGHVYGILRPGGNYHCYNVIGDCRFDLTSEQFGDEVLDYENNPEQFREVHFAKEEKRLRYEYLKEQLKKYTEKQE